MIYRIIINTLKNVFKPDPDMRYKFILSENMASDSSNASLMGITLKHDFMLELYGGEKIINLLSFKNKDGCYVIFGLPIFAYEDMKLNVIDTIDNEVIKTLYLNKGEYMTYEDLYN